MTKVKGFISLALFVLLVGIGGSCKAAPTIDWTSLGLNEDQMQKVGALDAQWHNSSKDVIPKIKEEQEQLNKTLENANASSQEIREASKRVISSESQLQLAAMENFIAKREVLTTEQRNKLLELLSK
ncbi:MAG: hypothetical protein WCK67_10110 [bacterium]